MSMYFLFYDIIYMSFLKKVHKVQSAEFPYVNTKVKCGIEKLELTGW